MTERMMMFAIQLGLILFLAKLGSVLFERMRLPGVLWDMYTVLTGETENATGA